MSVETPVDLKSRLELLLSCVGHMTNSQVTCANGVRLRGIEMKVDIVAS